MRDYLKFKVYNDRSQTMLDLKNAIWTEITIVVYRSKIVWISVLTMEVEI